MFRFMQRVGAERAHAGLRAGGRRPPWVSFQTWLAMHQLVEAQDLDLRGDEHAAAGQDDRLARVRVGDLAKACSAALMFVQSVKRVAVEVVDPAAVVVRGVVGVAGSRRPSRRSAFP